MDSEISTGRCLEIYSVAAGNWARGEIVQWGILQQRILFKSKISRTLSKVSLGFSLKTTFNQGYYF